MKLEESSPSLFRDYGYHIEHNEATDNTGHRDGGGTAGRISDLTMLDDSVTNNHIVNYLDVIDHLTLELARVFRTNTENLQIATIGNGKLLTAGLIHEVGSNRDDLVLLLIRS